MKKFISKIFILIIINIILYNLIIYSLYNKSFLISACTTPRNEKNDYVLKGTSHGQVFYKYIVEDTLSKKMKNLASGASGVIPQKIQLECFFQANNKTNQVVYLLDPWALYSSRWNENNYILQQENIEYSYLLKLFENNVDKKVLFNYFRDKLADNYDKFMRDLLAPKTSPIADKKETAQAVEELKRAEVMAQKSPEEQRKSNESETRQRLEILYNDGSKEENLLRYSKEVERVILLSQSNNAKIIFIIPPTLMGQMPGHKNVIKLLSEMKNKHKIEYFDLSLEMQNQRFYWDREHLNENGVKYFTENYLKNILDY